RDYKVTGVQTCALPICPRTAIYVLAVPRILRDISQKLTPVLRTGQLFRFFDERATAIPAVSMEMNHSPSLIPFRLAGCHRGVPKIGRASCRERGEVADV